jgi:hypothetical protein
LTNAATKTINVNSTELPLAVSVNLVDTVLGNNSNLAYNQGTGSFYKYVGTAATWENANTQAANSSIMGIAGHLVHINNANENDYIKAIYNTNPGWLGGSDKASDGAWKWYYGSAAGESFPNTSVSNFIIDFSTYKNWAPGEPNGGANESYAQMNHPSLSSGQWLDIAQTNSSMTNPYIIEYNGSAVLNQQSFSNTDNIKVTGSSVGTAYYVDTTVSISSVSDITALPDNKWNSVAVTSANITQVLSFENFDSAPTTWSNNTHTNLGGVMDGFLGRFNNAIGIQAVDKTYNFGQGQANTTVRLEFDMYELDSWDGELFNVFINNELKSSVAYHYEASGINDGGIDTGNLSNYLNGGWNNSAGTEEIHKYSLDVLLDNTGQVKIGFGAGLDEGVSNESFGIDNVKWSTIASGASLSLAGLSAANYDLYLADSSGNISPKYVL